MTQFQIAHVDGVYRVYATEFGTDRTYFEPTFKKPRAAIEYADALDGRAPRSGQESQGAATAVLGDAPGQSEAPVPPAVASQSLG